MRELKFRFWEPYTKRMLGPYSLYEIKNAHEVCAQCFDHVMQFTGLKDKNGVEIYEGDIITMHTEWVGGYHDDECSGEHKNKGVVAIVPSKGVMINKCMKLDVHECDGEWEKTWSVNVRGYRSVVIGNIYEHKHLIGEG